MIINIGDIVELKKFSSHYPKRGLVTKVTKYKTGTLVDLRWSPTHSGLVFLSGIDAVVPFEISAGEWVKGKPKKDGWYNCSIVCAYDVYRFCVDKEASQGFTKHSNIRANIVKPDYYGNNHPRIAYRRQSQEYAAWLRAKGLPVGEVHGE